MNSITFTLILIQSFILWVNGCGITTHTVIGHRASAHYDRPLDSQTNIKEILQNYKSAFQAGNPYPDLFYGSQCLKGSLAAVSEDTHWVPFLNATINYIRSHYTVPYNDDAKHLIAFTLGYASHQIADVNWHSLGIDQGFLSAMGFANYHGSFDAAHDVGDVGGDVLTQYGMNLDYIADLGDWYVPFTDLYNIYVELYGEEKVTKKDIEECSSILFLGRLGEKLAISLLYESYANKSTFLDDKLNDYFLGGLNDMATWTQLSWNKVLHMVDNGVDSCKIPSRSILDIDCSNSTVSNTKNRIKLGKNMDVHKQSVYQNILGSDKSYLNIEKNEMGLKISSSDKFNRLMKSLNKKKQKKITPKGKNLKKSIASYSIDKEYANLGYSLAAADVNNDNVDDLLIGAPVFSDLNNYQSGAAYILLSKDNSSVPLESLNVGLKSNVVLRPPKNVQNSRFGHSVIMMDLNQDGFQDIVVSAPSYNLQKLGYEGRVYIYLGDKDAKYQKVSTQISCVKFKYCNLGWALSKGDVNGDGSDDLIISSPYAATTGDQSGYLGILWSSKGNFKDFIDAAELDFVLTGSMEYEWFGHSAVAKNGYLAVGAPQSRVCAVSSCKVDNEDKQSVGKVYLYKYPSKTPIHVFRGEAEFEQFGYSFDITKNNIIAISSLTKEARLSDSFMSSTLKNAGVVQLYDFEQNFSQIAILKSDRSYANFGSKIKFFSSNKNLPEDLYISAQKRSSSELLISKEPEGLVYKFEDYTKLKGDVTADCSFFNNKPCPSEKAITFTNNEEKSKFGFEFTFLQSKNQVSTKLAVSSILSENSKLLMTGSVSLFEI